MRAAFGHARWKRIAALFTGFRLDDAGTAAAIRSVHESTGLILDPHSAIGVAAGLALHRPQDGALVALATAHPAKFPGAVEQATGVRPALPARLADLLKRPERCARLANDTDAVKAFIAERLRSRRP